MVTLTILRFEGGESLSQNIRRYFIYALTVSLVSSSTGFAASGPASEPPPLLPSSADESLSGLPFVNDFMKEPWVAPHWGPFDPKDPLLDQDPYFLRSQHWHSNSAAISDLRTRAKSDDKGFEVQISGSSISLRVDQPLRPVVEVDDYLFFQATSTDFFKVKASSEENYGEGLFFIDKRDLKNESMTGGQHGVPIFFFPMSGIGWTSKIESAEVPDGFPTVAFQTEDGSSVSIELEDMDLLSNALHQTLQLAVANEMRFLPGAISQSIVDSVHSENGIIHWPYVLPPAGSTAAFGSYATGMNLERPERSRDKIARSEKFDFHSLIFPEARADASLIPPDLATRLWVIGAASFGLIVTSVYTKYFVLKNKMVEISSFLAKQDVKRAIQKGKTPPNVNGRPYRAYAQFRDNISVFAHSLGAAFFAPNVLEGYFAEYGADRFFWLRRESAEWNDSVGDPKYSHLRSISDRKGRDE